MKLTDLAESALAEKVQLIVSQTLGFLRNNLSQNLIFIFGHVFLNEYGGKPE